MWSYSERGDSSNNKEVPSPQSPRASKSLAEFIFILGTGFSELLLVILIMSILRRFFRWIVQCGWVSFGGTLSSGEGSFLPLD